MKKEWVMVALLLGIPIVLRAIKGATAAAWAPIVPYPAIRTDSLGDGHYGASRGGHVHRGVDLEVNKGEPVYAPFSGIVIRVAYPYSDTTAWKGVELAGKGEWDGYSLKIFYMVPAANIVGSKVERGYPLGTAQAISERYSAAMQNHVHVELWRGSENIDPTPYIFPAA